MINPLFFSVLKPPSGGGACGEQVSHIQTTADFHDNSIFFADPTTVGSMAFCVVIYPSGTSPIPGPTGWTEYNTAVAPSDSCTIWRNLTTTPYTEVPLTNSEDIYVIKMSEFDGLTVDSITTPVSFDDPVGIGEIPPSSYTNIDCDMTFAIFWIGSAAGYGGGPDIYSWAFAGGGTSIDVSYTDDIFNLDQTMTGGGVGSGDIFVISAAFVVN